MLEAVVKKMKLRSKPGLGQSSGLKAIFTHEHGHPQPSCDEQGFVAEITG